MEAIGIDPLLNAAIPYHTVLRYMKTTSKSTIFI